MRVGVCVCVCVCVCVLYAFVSSLLLSRSFEDLELHSDTFRMTCVLGVCVTFSGVYYLVKCMPLCVLFCGIYVPGSVYYLAVCLT